MQLAVAGLEKDDITDRTQRLASGNWSGFTPAEQAAFAFARKLAKSSTVTPEDLRRLTDQFGTERALDVVWWVCRCHYMSCVADAFQLPLEEGNVFDGFVRAPRPSTVEAASRRTVPPTGNP